MRVVWIALLIVGCGADERPQAAARPAVRPSAPVEVEPATEARVRAIGSTSQLSPALQRAFDPAIDFIPMGVPKPGEWLAEHPEQPHAREPTTGLVPRPTAWSVL